MKTTLRQGLMWLVGGIVIFISLVAILYLATQYDEQTAPPESDVHLYNQSKEKLIGTIKFLERRLNIKSTELDKNKEKIAQQKRRILQLSDQIFVNNEKLTKQDKLLNKPRNMDKFECYGSKLEKDKANKVFICLTAIKLGFTEEYQSSGQMPTNLATLGLKLIPNEKELIQDIRFGTDGIIQAYLHSSFGKDKEVSLSPELSQSGNLLFSCTTNLERGSFDLDYCKSL